MALNQVVPWLIAYDIAEPRRLGRLYRYLRKRAVPIQYSVFMLRASPGRVGLLVRDMETLIDQRYDDVRVYRVPEPAHAVVRGRCLLPDGVLLLSSGGELTRTEA